MVHVTLPMDHLAIDCCKLNATDGYTHVLLIIDICTQFTWLYLLSSTTGDKVRDKLFLLVFLFGIP